MLEGWTQCRRDLRDDRKSWEEPGMASNLLLWVLGPCIWALCHYHFRFCALTEMQDFLKGRNVFVKFLWVLLIKDIFSGLMFQGFQETAAVILWLQAFFFCILLITLIPGDYCNIHLVLSKNKLCFLFVFSLVRNQHKIQSLLGLVVRILSTVHCAPVPSPLQTHPPDRPRSLAAPSSSLHSCLHPAQLSA